jgi:primosomal protein N' (replication factor Y)
VQLQKRGRLENLNLILSGYSPSSDVALQIDSKKIKYINARTDVSVAAFSPVSGTLLPGRIFTEIRSALKRGPVLFLAPRKGYGNALMCSHCKNIASCNCGGRLVVASKNVSPHCVHCGLIYKNWKCNFCNHEKQYLLSRGLDSSV